MSDKYLFLLSAHSSSQAVILQTIVLSSRRIAIMFLFLFRPYALSEPGHVLIVSEKSLGNVAEADVLSLGDGTAAYRLPNNGSVTMPACFDVQRRPGYTPPENAVLLSDTEPDVVPCQIGRQPIGLGCPVCPVCIGEGFW
uniref:Putative secreted protein n=1 Tax=Rhipicephalus microplus TaxID=6941 RepID=A0A6M2DBI0_RHIMP